MASGARIWQRASSSGPRRSNSNSPVARANARMVESFRQRRAEAAHELMQLRARRALVADAQLAALVAQAAQAQAAAKAAAVASQTSAAEVNAPASDALEPTTLTSAALPVSDALTPNAIG